MKYMITMLMTVFLLGCAPPSHPAKAKKIKTIYLEDGTPCAFYQGVHTAEVAMSCDWGRAARLAR